MSVVSGRGPALGRFKPIADFDWAWPKKIDRDAVESALRLDFIAQARNVVLVAPQGLGKTMLAQHIGHQAVLAGHSVRFVTASQLLLDLAAQESARALDRRLRHYGTRTTVLIVDEIGYLSYDNRNADLLFQVVSRRHEKRSLVLTTNLAKVAKVRQLAPYDTMRNAGKEGTIAAWARLASDEQLAELWDALLSLFTPEPHA